MFQVPLFGLKGNRVRVNPTNSRLLYFSVCAVGLRVTSASVSSDLKAIGLGLGLTLTLY